MATFDIRAELPGGKYRDFRVHAYDHHAAAALASAKQKAEDHIRATTPAVDGECRIEWRGLVAWVNREVPCGEPRRLRGFTNTTLPVSR